MLTREFYSTREPVMDGKDKNEDKMEEKLFVTGFISVYIDSVQMTNNQYKTTIKQQKRAIIQFVKVFN